VSADVLEQRSLRIKNASEREIASGKRYVAGAFSHRAVTLVNTVSRAFHLSDSWFLQTCDRQSRTALRFQLLGDSLLGRICRLERIDEKAPKHRPRARAPLA
jgi:hypothetical protein